MASEGKNALEYFTDEVLSGKCRSARWTKLANGLIPGETRAEIEHGIQRWAAEHGIHITRGPEFGAAPHGDQWLYFSVPNRTR